MQEINLLKSQIKDSAVIWQRRNKILTSVFVLVLVLEVGLAVVFFLLTQTTQASKLAVTDQNKQIQNSINQRQNDLVPAKAFQAQLQNLGLLVNKHIYWTGFFDELSKHTINKARFNSSQSNQDGSVHVEGEVSNYADLGKLLLGLSTSSNFRDVKLLASSPSKSEKFSIIFAIDFKLNPELLKSP